MSEEGIVVDEKERDADGLLRIVIKLAEEKPDYLKIQGMETIHPIHEALTALLRQNLSDQQIVQRFAKSEESLKEVMIVDFLLSRLNKDQSDQLINLLTSGAKLEEIIDRGALLVAEGKRQSNGNILYTVSTQNDGSQIMKFLKSSPYTSVYIESSEIQNIKNRISRRKKFMKNAFKSLMPITIGLLVLGNIYRSGIHETAGAFYNARQIKAERDSLKSVLKQLEYPAGIYSRYRIQH